MAASLVAGAAVGAVFGELLGAVLETRTKASMFKQTLNYLKIILLTIEPKIRELEKQNGDLGSSKQVLKTLKKEMEEGTKLVRKCSQIHRLNYVAKARYMDQLVSLIVSLVIYFFFDMQTQAVIDQKETLNIVRQINSTVNLENTAGPSSDSTTMQKADENAVQTNQTVEAMENNIKVPTIFSSWDSVPVFYDVESTSKAENNQRIGPCENAVQTNQTVEAMENNIKVPTIFSSWDSVPVFYDAENTIKAENNQRIGPLTHKISEPLTKKRFSGIRLSGAKFTSGAKVASGVKQFPPEGLVFLDGSYRFDIKDLLSTSTELIGVGSYGTTHKAILEDGRAVAVKRLKEVVEKREFEREVKIMQKLISKHPNVIPIRAYYYGSDEKLLIYDYMMAGSFFRLLHGTGDDTGRTQLDWESRMKIAHGAAMGIAHIHSADSEMNFVHGNIKSSNVLVTEDMQGCISDFGLNRLTHVSVNPSGNDGYRAPELVENTGELTQKSDVYSFGVHLLEMLTGESPSQNTWQVPNEVQCIEMWTQQVIDPKQPASKRQALQMAQLAMQCVEREPHERPSMVEVVRKMQEIRDIEQMHSPGNHPTPASLVGGAAVEAAFGELLKAVLETGGKANKFKQTLAYLRSTLLAIAPVIQEIELLHNDLGCSTEELERLIREMNEGTMHVRECSKINRLNYVARFRYQEQLEALRNSLERFFITDMSAQITRDHKDTQLEVRNILSRFDKFPLVNQEDKAGSYSDSIPVSASKIYDSTTRQPADENAVATNYTEETMENISQVTRNSSMDSDPVSFNVN